MIRRFIGVAGVAIAAAACGQPLFHAPPRPAPAHAPVHPPPTSSSEIGIVMMSRGPCFGRCPASSTILYREGLVLRRGKGDAGLPGCAVGRIADSTFRALADALFRTGFFQLNEHLGRPVMDAATLTVSVHLSVFPDESWDHTVSGEEDPPELTRYERMIDSITGTVAWDPATDTLALAWCARG